MIKAKFVDLIRKEGTPARHVILKGNQRPRNAISGGNGNWVIPGEPPKMFLYVKGIDGKYYKNEVHKRVLTDTNRKRMNENLYLRLYDKFQGATFDVDEKQV